MEANFESYPPGLGDDGGGGPFAGDKRLLAAGWERRFLADPSRAEETIELYTSLGYEVRAENLTPADFGPQCGKCPKVVCRSYVLIYTRRAPQQNDKPT